MTPCMNIYKGKIQSDGILDKLKFRIVVRRYLNNKEIIGDTWSPTASTRTLKYLLADSVKNESRVNKLDFIGALLQAIVNNRVFMKFDSIYVDYFPEYSRCFVRYLRFLKCMYIMTNYGKLFAIELTE